jgi:hypothetical protein
MNATGLSIRFTKPLFALTLFIIVFANAVCSFGQIKASDEDIRGSILDDAESAPIRQAHVWVHEQSGRSSIEARPDASGDFAIHLPPGYYFVLVGAPGFAPFSKSVWVQPNKPIVLRVRMLPASENMQESR